MQDNAGLIDSAGADPPDRDDPPAGVIDEVRSCAEVLADARRRVEPAYRRVVGDAPDRLRHVIGYHAGWWDAQGEPGHSSGKGIRAALTLLSAAATAEGPASAATRQATMAALAVELVHDFSLLHDDIMDGDRARRHRPAVWVEFGTAQAILAGDLLLSLAVEVLADHHPAQLPILTRALRTLCAGQQADLAFDRFHPVELDSCLRVAENKTGALMGAACELGASIAGARPERASRMGAYGRRLGLLYQLDNDIRGIWGDPVSTGRPRHSDLRHRKKTLPVVAALNSGTAAGDELARWYALDTEPTGDELADAATLIERAGARRWARDVSAEISAEAVRTLESACPRSAASAELRALLTTGGGSHHG